MRRKRGFTLIEIMIVVAIIALLAAIAIPNLLNARRTANEAAARSNIRTLLSELEAFAAGQGDGAYPANVAAFVAAPSAAAARYCDTTSTTSTCTTAAGCGGYVYGCTVAVGGYTITGTPVSPQTGTVTYRGTTGGAMTP